MKLCLLAFILSLPVLSFSGDPERASYTYLNIFHNKPHSDGTVEVKVSVYDSMGEVSTSGKTNLLPAPVFKKFFEEASAVYEMVPLDRHQEVQRFGSAFSIGNNLVLTAHHVLSESFKNTSSCDDFRLRDPKTSTSYDCKKVHFCDPVEDICLIEMEPKTIKSCFFCRHPQTIDVSIAKGVSLKIAASVAPVSDSQVITIGNSNGLGIHVSEGTGIDLKNNALYFYGAFVTGGNSGGPLIDDQTGTVIGVVKKQSDKIRVGPLAYNVAAPTSTLVRLLREALRSDPETLGKFNQAVVE